MAKEVVEVQGKDSGATKVLTDVRKALKGVLDVSGKTHAELEKLQAQMKGSFVTASNVTQAQLNNWKRNQNEVTKALAATKLALDQEKAAMRSAATQTQALATANTKAAVATKATGTAALNARRGISTMRGAMGTLAATSLGAQGRLGEVAGIMGSFAIGNALTLGVLSGLAAIAVAYKVLTQDAKDLTEENEKARESLLKLGETPSFKLMQQTSATRETQRQREKDVELLQTFIKNSELASSLQARVLMAPSVKRGLGTVKAGQFMAAITPEAVINLATAAMTELSAEIASGEIGLNKAAERARELADDMGLAAAYAKLVRIPSPGGSVETLGDPLNRTNALVNRSRRLAQGAGTNPRTLMLSDPGSALLPPPRGFTGGFNESLGAANSILSGNQARGALSLTRANSTAILDQLRAAGVDPATLTGPLKRTFNQLNNVLEEGAEGVKTNSRQYVSAIAMSANAIAGMITGRSSALGGLGGLAAGLSSMPGIGDAAGLGLGIAGIGLSFLDALTSDRGKDAMSEAHLKALREANEERPPANIFINIPGFDPANRDHQRIITDATREAESSGYAVKLQRGTA
jgi:hypothetical protein